MSSADKDIENLKRETVDMAARTSSDAPLYSLQAESAIAADSAKSDARTFAEKVILPPSTDADKESAFQRWGPL